MGRQAHHIAVGCLCVGNSGEQKIAALAVGQCKGDAHIYITRSQISLTVLTRGIDHKTSAMAMERNLTIFEKISDRGVEIHSHHSIAESAKYFGPGNLVFAKLELGATVEIRSFEPLILSRSEVTFGHIFAGCKGC